MDDIFTLYSAIRRHPDYAGGAIFVRGRDASDGDTRILTDEEAAQLRRALEDGLAEAGNEIIADEGFLDGTITP